MSDASSLLEAARAIDAPATNALLEAFQDSMCSAMNHTEARLDEFTRQWNEMMTDLRFLQPLEALDVSYEDKQAMTVEEIESALMCGWV